MVLIRSEFRIGQSPLKHGTGGIELAVGWELGRISPFNVKSEAFKHSLSDTPQTMEELQ